jgi:hypothetical protein
LKVEESETPPADTTWLLLLTKELIKHEVIHFATLNVSWKLVRAGCMSLWIMVFEPVAEDGPPQLYSTIVHFFGVFNSVTTTYCLGNSVKITVSLLVTISDSTTSSSLRSSGHHARDRHCELKSLAN